MPAGITAGDLLLVFVANVGTAPSASGWTQVSTQATALSTTQTLLARIATGGDTCTVSVGGGSVSQSVRVTGHGVTDVVTDIVYGTAATEDQNAPDCPALSPGSTKDWLYFAQSAARVSSGNTVSGTPTGYTSITTTRSGTGAGAGLNLAYKGTTGSSSDNPSATSTSGSGPPTVSQTYAIPPGSAPVPPGEGTFTAYDHTHVSWVGDAPAVPAAEGTFTAYDHTEVDTAGARDSSGTASLVDETTVEAVGSAPAPVSPEVASVTGVAHNAGTDVDTFTDVEPAFAQVTTAAHPPVLLIDPSAAVASSSAAAHGASVDAAAAAGVGAAGVSAYPTQSTVEPSAGVSSVGVAAFDASVSTDSSVGVPADVASVSVAASDVEIHLAVNALIAQTQGSAVNPGVDSPDMGRKRRSGLGGAVLVGAEIGEPLRPPVGR